MLMTRHARLAYCLSRGTRRGAERVAVVLELSVLLGELVNLQKLIFADLGESLP